MSGLGFVATVAAVVAGGCCCFLAACVEADAPWPLGSLARAAGAALSGVAWLLRALRLMWIFEGVAAAAHWFMYRRHPIIQILYVALVFGGYGVFIVYGYPLMPNLFMAGYHKWLGLLVFGVCVVTFCLASFTDAGTVTADNVTAYSRLYPYDGFMYELRDCKTCSLQKVRLPRWVGVAPSGGRWAWWRC
jgi:hypothetical protein